jgi:3'-phosphoadenosine 5'-phosphosulfate sulfotransferase (PAPS reductase)/FAD synthetase
MEKVRHVLGISGGKDSTALAIYLNKNYPELDVEYYFCDTGKELDETYELLNNLEFQLGKKIARLRAAETSHEDPFDHHLKLLRGYLPSPDSRWCTLRLKLAPFEKFVGNDPVISYVAIRGDEDREGYISKKINIQSIFPFRKNIWSEEIVSKVLKNENIQKISALYSKFSSSASSSFILEKVNRETSLKFTRDHKLSVLLNFDVVLFNKVVFNFLKSFDYPVSKLEQYELINNSDCIEKKDVIRILTESVGMPKYYNPVKVESDNTSGHYFRSRSGCYFCFFQQKIEWVWLYEQHPHLFKKALEYEKNGYTWNEHETLDDLIKPVRMNQIKEEFLNKSGAAKNSSLLIDILDDSENRACSICSI